MKKSVVTDDLKYCIVCGKPAECTHHLIFGKGNREFADEDGLKIPLCNDCHNMAVKSEDRIHENPMAEKLSKMLGQAIYESKIGTRDNFIRRYGKSYL